MSVTTPSNTASANVSAPAVQQLLSQDIQTAGSLLVLLKEEHQILQQRDHTRLGTLVGEKQVLMAKLEQSTRQRSAWVNFLVQRTGMSNEVCWNRLLNELDPVQLPPLWNELQALINECKQHNDLNGKMIARGQKTLQKLMGLMRGQMIEPANLYTAKGSTQTHSNSHTVVKA
ncbi:flagellar protein FlgN [Aestuariicella sp. G3-2]|uniref:flagella synthesis protein FlgN n=1 Tax=Pseudomaricurvus albidus TaxID=2842452 RepID=UPI001C0C8400|nr:flagellar protein FlgN [Aestuariicella albida]MBU3071143.1 flagellar protein FlgN [Aestuariicella albida]